VKRLALTLCIASCATSKATTMTTANETTSGYADVNGVHLYYETRGSGPPLILVHGAFGSVESFGPNVALLARTRTVITVELQGHGRTADIDRPLSSEAFGDDLAALIEHLGYEQADVMGFSLGGGAAAQAAIRHPERIRRLVIVSTVFARSGWYPEARAIFDAWGPHLAAAMKQSPNYAHYTKVAPRPQDFDKLVEKLGAIVKHDYDWLPLVDEKRMPPTLIVAGDADGMNPSHLVAMFARLGGGQRDPGWDGSAGRSSSQLAILPGKTHYDIATSPELVAAVMPFLDR
jgi:pimeloyl-ACP methyl ester carboxylesterase